MAMSADVEFQNPCDKAEGEFRSELFDNGTVEADSTKNGDKNLKTRTLDTSTPSNGVVPMSHSSFNTDEANNKSDRRDCCTHLKQSVILVWIERIILISVCVAIAGGFTVPIIIYVIDTDQGGNSTISVDFDIDNCPSDKSIPVSKNVAMYVYLGYICT